jgi:hypothetical protein
MIEQIVARNLPILRKKQIEVFVGFQVKVVGFNLGYLILLTRSYLTSFVDKR